MILRPEHKYSWTTDWKTAEYEQAVFAEQVDLHRLDLASVASTLAVGVAYRERDGTAISVGRRATCTGVPVGEEHYEASVVVDFPYVPGLFAYREGPAVCRMLEEVDFEPDLLLMDTQGIAHPRLFGLASHVGVITGIATLGVTRKPLRGRPRGTHPPDGVVPLYDRDRQVGAVLCRSNVPVLYGSPGHRTDVPTVMDWMCTLQEPGESFPLALAQAHRAANRRAGER